MDFLEFIVESLFRRSFLSDHTHRNDESLLRNFLFVLVLELGGDSSGKAVRNSYTNRKLSRDHTRSGQYCSWVNNCLHKHQRNYILFFSAATSCASIYTLASCG
jgi:hypothetical protein